MSAGSDQLVNQVLQRVLEALKASPEMPGQSGVPGVFASAGMGPSAPEGPAQKKVWITAAELESRARGRHDVSLAANEFPTPAAWDFALANGVEIKKESPRTGVEHGLANDNVTMPPAGLGCHASTRARGEACASGVEEALAHPKIAALMHVTGLMVRQSDRKVEAVLAGLGRSGVLVKPFDAADCSLANLRALCNAIAGGEIGRGIAIDKHAAMGMVYAAKLPRIRPVQGVSVAAVEAGIRQFDANLLVIGHADVSQFEMQTMIRKFALAPGPARTAMMESLTQLER